MQIKNLTSKDIEKMNYNELIALVKETNRPPGGSRSIYYILDRLFISKESKILEIGTSTGFTALEIARLTKSEVKAIDINETSLGEAKERAKKENLENIIFMKADARVLPFEDGCFDLVFCGNLLSIIDKKEKAFEELKRVTKKSGFIAAIPMYYVKKPSQGLARKVSEAIGINITVTDKDYWLSFLKNPHFEIYFVKDFIFEDIKEEKVKEFVKNILSREHLKQLSKEAMEVLKRKYEEHMLLFRENLSHMGYLVIILKKKNESEDPELFTSKEVK